VGRGSHFLEGQAVAEGWLSLRVHRGSRAIGQAISEHHLRQATPSTTGLLFLEADSEAGQAYLHDLDWASRYAEASRRAMLDAAAALVAELFGAGADGGSVIHCNHNHVRRETHLGGELWVHRKGAVSAGDDEPGIIPGSMGTPGFHVAGRGCAEALGSSSHGAGRRMSRTQALRRVRADDLERQLGDVWFDHRLAGRLRDEAPSAYKDIHAVMRAQRDLTRIVCSLRPLLSYKGA
jgi:tRNA-splicing ligase RtcB